MKNASPSLCPVLCLQQRLGRLVEAGVGRSGKPLVCGVGTWSSLHCRLVVHMFEIFHGKRLEGSQGVFSEQESPGVTVFDETLF